MSESKYAPKRDDGLLAYVVTTHQWGQQTDRIEWATSLKEAKAEHGWTRMLYTTMTVRRATRLDLAAPVRPEVGA